MATGLLAIPVIATRNCAAINVPRVRILVLSRHSCVRILFAVSVGTASRAVTS